MKDLKKENRTLSKVAAVKGFSQKNNFCFFKLPTENLIAYICKVKLLTIIFSFYLLVLPLLPCMDDDTCSKISQITSVVKASHSDQKESQENCNPFCNCMCCSNIATPNFVQYKTVTAKNNDVDTVHSFYQNISLPSDFFGNIWEPPKIS